MPTVVPTQWQPSGARQIPSPLVGKGSVVFLRLQGCVLDDGAPTVDVDGPVATSSCGAGGGGAGK